MIGEPAVDNFVELFFCQRAVFKEVREVLAGKFSVVPAYQSDAFFRSDLAVTDLVGRVRRRSADAKFDVGQVVMKAVDAIVEAGVLRLCAFRPFWVRAEPGVFGALDEIPLRGR